MIGLNSVLLPIEQALSSYVFLTALYAVAIPGRVFILTSLTRRLLTVSFAMANVQVLLGLSTLLYLVPTELAAGHQAGSLLLLSALLATLVSCRRGSQLTRFKVMV
jgi:cytochrome c oxidase assembly protein subunit 15